MKLTEHFNTFLAEIVNLNQNRIDTLRARVDSIASTLETFEVYSDLLIETCTQGSWAHQTIIKPPGASGFDADIIIFMKPHKGWSSADYVENLYMQFKRNGTYANKVSRKTRCVTIQYAGEFSIDVVPCIRKYGILENSEWILNREKNSEERIDPKGYNAWFKKKNDYVGNNNLLKVVRLLKYLRDVKKTFSVKSVLLTTLIGERIQWLLDADLGFGNRFTDLPTTLLIIIRRLDKHLQDNPDMLEVCNPSLTDESFTRHWDQDKYSNFRECIHRYALWIEDAYVEEDRDESILKWRRIFGDSFARSANIEKSVDALLAVKEEDLSHVELPEWPSAPSGNISITASLHSEAKGDFKGTYQSNGPMIKPETWLHFSAIHSFGNGISIKWQIANTGEPAKSANTLRGEIKHTGEAIWQQARFKGSHWVECFAIDKKQGVCLGRSGRFYVNVA